MEFVKNHKGLARRSHLPGAIHTPLFQERAVLTPVKVASSNCSHQRQAAGSRRLARVDAPLAPGPGPVSCEGDRPACCQHPCGLGRPVLVCGWAILCGAPEPPPRRVILSSFCLEGHKGREGPRRVPHLGSAALPALRALPSQSPQAAAALASNKAHRLPTPHRDLSPICSEIVTGRNSSNSMEGIHHYFPPGHRRALGTNIDCFPIFT